MEELIVLLSLSALAAWVLGVIAFLKVGPLEQRIQQLETALRKSKPVQPEPEPEPPAPIKSEPDCVPVAPTYTREDKQVAATQPQNSSPDWTERLLQNMRTHWMVWLGGLCVGLSGVFMVRYSIEQGLLGPKARVLLSLLAGVALHVVAERLYRNKGQNNVFAALAGGASMILYAALFAAFKLWPGISPTLIFVAMAFVSFITLALALRHGPVLAGLGMLGGYLVPVLVDSGSGQIELALVYISILTFFSLWLLAYVQQRWLWVGVLAGSLLWWAISLFANPALGTRSLYLLVLAYLLLAVPRFDWQLRWTPTNNIYSWLEKVKHWRADPHWPALVGLLLVVLAQGVTLGLEGMAVSGYFTVLALPTLLLFAARQRAEVHLLVLLTLLLTVFAIVWPMLMQVQGQWFFIAPGGQTRIALAVHIFYLAFLYTGLSYMWLQQQVTHKPFWVGLACGTPLLLLALSYYLFSVATSAGTVDEDFTAGIQFGWVWGLVALLLGLFYLWLAKRNESIKTNDPAVFANRLISAILISAAHVGISLAAVIWLADATLPLAFALQLVSLAWLQKRFALPLMAWVIRAVLLLVVVRLTLNPWLLSYSADTHWSLWTYGGATLCAAAAAWILRTEIKMQPWLQGGAAHLLVLTLAAEVRYWLYDGDVFYRGFSALEASLDVVIWGSAAVLYLWRARLSERLPRFYNTVGLLHLAAATATYVLFVLLQYNPLWSANNPLWNDTATPVFNILLLSYGLPTLIMLALAWQVPTAYRSKLILTTGLNGLLFVSLEIRQLWQGDAGMNMLNTMSNGELYTYSLVWMLLAAAAMTGGRWLANMGLYRAGMALLLVVVAKLFLIDMSGLVGLWRVASFMGLGLALLALAWMHQRYKMSNAKNPVNTA